MRIIVTGGNSGVGKATATALASAGHDVMIACRTMRQAPESARRLWDLSAELTGCDWQES